MNIVYQRKTKSRKKKNTGREDIEFLTKIKNSKKSVNTLKFHKQYPYYPVSSTFFL